MIFGPHDVGLELFQGLHVLILCKGGCVLLAPDVGLHRLDPGRHHVTRQGATDSAVLEARQGRELSKERLDVAAVVLCHV